MSTAFPNSSELEVFFIEIHNRRMAAFVIVPRNPSVFREPDARADEMERSLPALSHGIYAAGMIFAAGGFFHHESWEVFAGVSMRTRAPD
jgi:hypothetical protein